MTPTTSPMATKMPKFLMGTNSSTASAPKPTITVMPESRIASPTRRMFLSRMAARSVPSSCR